MSQYETFPAAHYGPIIVRMQRGRKHKRKRWEMGTKGEKNARGERRENVWIGREKNI